MAKNAHSTVAINTNGVRIAEVIQYQPATLDVCFAMASLMVVALGAVNPCQSSTSQPGR
jgi:hypothetical protein